MTRGQQTAWIVGCMLLIAVVGLGFALDTPDECDGFFGVVDEDCEFERAYDHLMSL